MFKTSSEWRPQMRQVDDTPDTPDISATPPMPCDSQNRNVWHTVTKPASLVKQRSSYQINA